MKINPNKIKKSASLAHFNLDFNPSQFKCGYSKIEKIPDKRPQSKQTEKSKSHKEKVSQEKAAKESEAYEINVLKRINQSLERENQLLKKQLQYYNQSVSSRRSSIAVKNEESYKDKILNRINGSRVSTKNDSESTGFGSSKMTTARGLEDSISDLYEKYSTKSIKPAIESLYEVGKAYFGEFKENYLKLKTMFNTIKSDNELILNKKIEELLKLFEVPIIFKEKPDLLARSLSKEVFKKSKPKRIETEMKGQGFEAELRSPTETLIIFQNLVKVISMSPKLLERVSKSKVYLNLEKKIKMI